MTILHSVIAMKIACNALFFVFPAEAGIQGSGGRFPHFHRWWCRWQPA